MMIKFIIVSFVILLVVSGCGFIKSNMQPVVSFLITSDKKENYESIILSLSTEIASNNKLSYATRDYSISDIKHYQIIIEATSSENGVFYALALTSGEGADFIIFITKTKIDITISGLPSEQKVHKLIKDWQKSLDESKIEYFKLIRQPYLDNQVTPDEDPHWEGIKGYPSRKE